MCVVGEFVWQTLTNWKVGWRIGLLVLLAELALLFVIIDRVPCEFNGEEEKAREERG